MRNNSTRSINPVVLTVMGATGDLATHKIIPSLWRLFLQGRLPEGFAVIGFARSALSLEEFRGRVRQILKERRGGDGDVERFLSLFSYESGIFDEADAFDALASRIREKEMSWGLCADKLFYLAVPPSHYEAIFKNLARVKLNLPCGGEGRWSRILVEKPFGHDLESSRKLQELLSEYFREEQIYRIDHYLAKEIVEGIIYFRFSNNLFERSWSNAMIERIEIRLLETIGVEERGGFYEPVGAFRDVGQNHLLEMLAAITMEYPPDMAPSTIRRNRASVLQSLKGWTDEQVRKDTYRAQYRGYREIKDVNPGSDTETYFALSTELTHPLWKGVPIYLEAGKRCAEARKEIVVTLKHPPACLLCEPGRHTRNQVIFQMEPSDRIVIRFWSKKPGYERALEERSFSFFLYEKEDRSQYVEEYAKLLHAAMAGDQTLFASGDEVEALWKFADPVLKGWESGIVPLDSYEAGTTPTESLLSRDEQISPESSGHKEIGLVGLGKMGANLARRMAEKKWSVVGYNISPEPTRVLAGEKIIEPAFSLVELAQKLSSPRVVWLMVPAGKAVEESLFGKGGLAGLLSPGDTVIDGGNSFYKDSIRRAEELEKRGILFVDVGVSGGPVGALNGPSLMIGGQKQAFEMLEPLFRDLAPEGGCRFFGGYGAGHFIKMIHNGIEYGMMQAIAEGFTILKEAPYRLNLADVADVYNHGSVIESRLMGWLKEAFELFGDDLASVSGSVGHTGEGKWTVDVAREKGVAARVIELAHEFRVESERNPSYAGKILTALRNRFGRHAL